MRSARGDILDFAAVDTGSSRHRSCNLSLVALPVCAEAEVFRQGSCVAATPEEWVLDSGKVLDDIYAHEAAGYEKTTGTREHRCLSASVPVAIAASKQAAVAGNEMCGAGWRGPLCAE